MTTLEELRAVIKNNKNLAPRLMSTIEKLITIHEGELIELADYFSQHEDTQRCSDAIQDLLFSQESEK